MSEKENLGIIPIKRKDGYDQCAGCYIWYKNKEGCPECSCRLIIDHDKMDKIQAILDKQHYRGQEDD